MTSEPTARTCQDCDPEGLLCGSAHYEWCPTIAGNAVRESCDNPFGRSAAKRREVDHGRA